MKRKREKLLQLNLDGRITDDFFAEQERQLTATIAALEADHGEAVETARKSNALVEAFERAAAILRDPAFEFDTIWEHANVRERRVLVEELIEAVTIHADRLEVTVVGAPPLIIRPVEVGLHDPVRDLSCRRTEPLKPVPVTGAWQSLDRGAPYRALRAGRDHRPCNVKQSRRRLAV